MHAVIDRHGAGRRVLGRVSRCCACACVCQVSDPSLLRFLVDLRDADLSDKQLRDDLMTMLIAGHETTAAVLTWTLFSLLTHPPVMERALQEIDAVLGDATPGALAA